VQFVRAYNYAYSEYCKSLDDCYNTSRVFETRTACILSKNASTPTVALSVLAHTPRESQFCYSLAYDFVYFDNNQCSYTSGVLKCGSVSVRLPNVSPYAKPLGVFKKIDGVGFVPVCSSRVSAFLPKTASTHPRTSPGGIQGCSVAIRHTLWDSMEPFVGERLDYRRVRSEWTITPSRLEFPYLCALNESENVPRDPQMIRELSHISTFASDQSWCVSATYINYDRIRCNYNQGSKLLTCGNYSLLINMSISVIEGGEYPENNIHAGQEPLLLKQSDATVIPPFQGGAVNAKLGTIVKWTR